MNKHQLKIFADLKQRNIFSDESRFSLSADDHRTRVWRRTGQRSDPAFIVERHTTICDSVGKTRSSLVGYSLYWTINADYQVAQVPNNNNLRDSPNNVFKDMTFHGLPGHQIFHQ
ncbi:hypothetical protein TNCV_945401 [Trichonephila clavipes]|nr:hypothetical protein TNCV_945401 [Trichonephila clavipes]